MYEPRTPLSSDLEWMLESGQVGSDVLAETLVQEYASQLYRSARLLVWSEALACQALVRALGAALASLYGYRREVGVKVWLYRFLIAECRKSRRESAVDLPEVWVEVDSQKQVLRELGVLIYANGLEVAEAAQVVGIAEFKAERLLKELRLNLLLEGKYANITQLANGDADRHKPLKETAIDTRLKEAAQSLAAGWSDEILSFQEIAHSAQAEAARQGGRRRGFARFQELLWVGVVIALVGALIWGSGWLMAGEETDQELQVTLQTVIVEVTTTPQPLAAGDRVPQTTPIVERTAAATLPLSLASDSETIRSRMEGAFNIRQSIWLDADLRLYYPQSVQGFPKEYRVQFWLDDEQVRFLILSGPLGAPVQEIFLNLHGHSFQAQRSESGSYDFLDLAGGEGIQGYYLVMQSFLSLLNRFKEGDQYIPQEVTRLLDRSVLVVDQVNQAGGRVASFLLDVNSGLALRQRYYNPEDQSPLLDVDYRNLSINPRFPNEVFALDFGWDGAYPVNELLEFEAAEEESLESVVLLVTRKPPAGYNPNDQALHFEFEYIYPQRIWEPDLLEFRASIFTDDYYLGDVDFANPWGVICDRSSDGGKLAFANTEWSTNSIHWFDLNDLVLQSHQVNGTVSQLAFSPDGQRLAFFSAGQLGGSIRVLDLAVGAIQSILNIPDVRSLVWSPDGQYLAFIGRNAPPNYEDRVMVVEVGSRNVTYENSVDFNPDLSGEWPPLKWGVDFPLEMVDLATCALPPTDG